MSCALSGLGGTGRRLRGRRKISGIGAQLQRARRRNGLRHAATTERWPEAPGGCPRRNAFRSRERMMAKTISAPRCSHLPDPGACRRSLRDRARRTTRWRWETDRQMVMSQRSGQHRQRPAVAKPRQSVCPHDRTQMSAWPKGPAGALHRRRAAVARPRAACSRTSGCSSVKLDCEIAHGRGRSQEASAIAACKAQPLHESGG